MRTNTILRCAALLVALAALAPAAALAQTAVTGYAPSDCGTPGHLLVVEGTGFNAQQPMTLAFTDAAGTGTVPARVIRHSDTRALTVIPQGAGTGPVTANGGTPGPAFNVLDAGSPVIFAVRPTTVQENGWFVIVGYSLGDPQITTVSLDATVLTNVRGGGRFLAAQATVPPGTYTLSLAKGSLTTGPCTVQITVVAATPPDITGVTPTSGDPGSVYRIDGTGLGPIGLHPVEWALQSTPGTVAATSAVLSNGSTEAHGVVPRGLAAGAYVVTFHAPGGTDTFNFTVTTPTPPTLQTPVIQALDPDSGTATIFGSLPRPFRIVGTSFVQQGGGRPTISFGGGSAPVLGFFLRPGGVQVLVTVVPRGTAPGVYGVEVTNAGGTSNSVDFTVTP